MKLYLDVANWSFSTMEILTQSKNWNIKVPLTIENFFKYSNFFLDFGQARHHVATTIVIALARITSRVEATDLGLSPGHPFHREAQPCP